jgi:CheY-like chemotaxis protein/predicted Ser/Thr protein kinase
MTIDNRQRASSEAETVQIQIGDQAPVALAYYRLRAAAHHIAADCERLLGELDGTTHELWRDAMGKALLAAQQMRSLIERDSGRKSGGRARVALDALQAAIREPRQKIVDAMSALLALIPTAVEEEMIMQDARAIRELALGLFAPEASAPGGAITAPAMASKSGATARILVADDEEALRRHLLRMLERLGYQVILARNGREALELAERELPDVIITDLSMPEMTGHELLARLKSNERTQHIPVIVVSGDADTSSVVKCLEQGAEDHLSKPYEPVVLQARVRTSLERKRMRDLELAYLRRVAQLTAAAEAVERQAYDSHMLGDLGRQTDQLGQLARVFDRMIGGIRSREAQLESRVRHLRREMEETAARLPATPPLSEDSHYAVGEALAGRYEIKRELGKGGMGMVYLARDRELDEDVAIKIVRRDILGQDPTLLERLKSEIRLARRISHTNVVRSHDLGEWEGVYFLSMEYIQGTTVADLIASHGRLSLDSTLAIATQLVDALAVAHAAQIIHRDIKPSNLLVDESGTLKVTDFGLARPVQRNSAVTQAGLVVGTPRYMSPEQLMGDQVDGRTDLFATGVVLYECLTGRVPFDAETGGGLIAQMLAGPPVPVRHFLPTVPPALEAIIDRLLQREAERRFKSARDLAEELGKVS